MARTFYSNILKFLVGRSFQYLQQIFVWFEDGDFLNEKIYINMTSQEIVP